MADEGNLRQSTVINLWAGAGTGKSTTCAGFFFYMKQRGLSVEMAREWVKETIWENRPAIIENQIYIFAKQLKRITDLIGKVDYIICDSPIPFPLIYSDSHYGDPLHALTMQEFRKMKNVNFYVQRSKPYVQAGRVGTEEEARAMDFKIMAFLVEERIPFITIDPSTYDLNELLDGYVL